MVNVNYTSAEGSYKSSPGVQSAALIQGLLVIGIQIYHQILQDTGLWSVDNVGWALQNLNTDGYFQVGSSFPVKF